MSYRFGEKVDIVKVCEREYQFRSSVTSSGETVKSGCIIEKSILKTLAKFMAAHKSKLKTARKRRLLSLAPLKIEFDKYGACIQMQNRKWLIIYLCGVGAQWSSLASPL